MQSSLSAEDIRLAKNGDHAAFSRLYAQVYKELYHIARFSLRSAQDAADAVSATVLDAYTGLAGLRDETAFCGWLCKILTAKIKRIQREYCNAGQPLTDADTLFADYAYGSHELRQALRTLSDDDRLLLSLSVLGGYTSAELARLTDATPDAVRARLSRMKAALRRRLTEPEKGASER